MPTFDFTKFAALLDSAGITVIEASQIFKVSRPTVYHWRNGNAPNQQLLLTQTVKMAKLVEAAVDAKDLPLNPDTDPLTRVKDISAQLRKHLNR